MNFFKRISLILVFILGTLVLSGCGDKNTTENKDNATTSEPLSKTELVIGTVCTITLYDNKDSAIIDKAFDKLYELEDILSINKSDTELDEVNDNAGIQPTKVSKDTLAVVKEGLEYSKLSKGALDITVGPLVKLWGIGTDSARLPSEEEIDAAKDLVDYEDVDLDEANSTIYLKEKGMIIDLGAIAKGYAADQVVNILKENGVSSAIVDLGGNIFAVGEKNDGSAWKVGVQNPEEARNDTIGYVSVKNKSVVTSGVYERYLTVDGVNYHHILNPETGYPFENDILGVSIISETSIDGDSLSTTLFALGVEEGLKFINNLDGVDAIFITKDHNLYLSENFKDIFTLTNEEYKIK